MRIGIIDPGAIIDFWRDRVQISMLYERELAELLVAQDSPFRCSTFRAETQFYEVFRNFTLLIAIKPRK